MSSELIDCANNIDTVDVDEGKENGSKSVLSCDSGIEIHESSSPADSPSSTNNSPERDVENDIELHIKSTQSGALESGSELSTPTSLSSDIGNNILKYNEYSSDKNTTECSTHSNACIYSNDLKTESTSDLCNDGLPRKSLYLNSERAITTSTISLNESTIPENKLASNYSQSAENISLLPSPNTYNDDKTSSVKELDKDKIISEFTVHKNKACATQKIVPENPQILDVRYARLPKEILSQDLGNIVKNVHGIFSSVSGSLKNAYNHSHRISQKPQIKNIKPITNGKIMTDIFEDADDRPNKRIDKVNTESIVSSESVEKPNNEDTDSKNEMHKLQIESLERVLFEQRKENSSLRERFKQQVDELQAKDQTFKELEAKVDLMCKRAEQAQREKDAAVMRYASTECAAIEAKKAAENATKAERAAVAERELLSAKLKTAREEKQRICQLYDDKCHELQNSEKEVARVREEFRELEGRLKWTQSKLRMEMEVSKESLERAEKLSQQVAELEAGKEAAIINASDSARAKQLDTELKESQAALILCRHENEDLERRLSAALQQLETCRRERDDATSSLSNVTKQVEVLKESNVRLEEEAAELAALRAQAALADTLSAQLQRETERACLAEQALSAERARAETCSRREAGALEHAARLTAQHVASRASANEHEAKAQALAADNASLRETIEMLQSETERLKGALEEETDRRNRENRVLARKVAELTEDAADAQKKLEWEKGENSVLKKKHASAIKELNRELQRALKRIEQLEAKLPQNDSTSIRTGSVSSLSSGETPAQEDRLQNGHALVEPLPDVQIKRAKVLDILLGKSREPDRQVLVERIVSLQRAAAARSERCEFLQEHCAQLTRELRGKNRLLRALLPTLPPAALASANADEHKKEIARLGGGAMAAVWGGDPAGMTLELSLEMNQRLQAVLEDTLLKNITLKENMDTLGEEISRLREQMKIGDKK